MFYKSLHEKKLSGSYPSELHDIDILTKYQKVTETYRKQETVVNFDTTNRRGGGEVRLRNGYWIGWLRLSDSFYYGTFSQLSDLASSPLITGDPDSREEKYKRRAPTDWFLR